MKKRIGFEYRKGIAGEEVPFVIFLNYSDEKEKSSGILGKILSRLLVREKMTLLDIGSGTGEYLRLALSKVRDLKGVSATLLEPSQDLAGKLRSARNLFPRTVSVDIVGDAFENFTTATLFDIILASHVPLAKDNIARLPVIYLRMLKLLKPDGHLVIVLRGKDDIHQFRTRFKTKIMGRDYYSLTIDDAEALLQKIAEQLPLRIEKFSVKAKLHLPYPDVMQDVISVVEFLLNTNWKDIPAEIRDSILDYIRGRNGFLRQIDGFLVVRKIHHRKRH
ncbi:MAG: methyltransferase domain-containing protein [bacterium]